MDIKIRIFFLIGKNRLYSMTLLEGQTSRQFFVDAVTRKHN